MNGAQSLVKTLLAQGVDMCFANPGTSEMHFLAALDNPAMRSVLCLFEGVATGAADGYFRMNDTPASTLLHLGPGLANGLANVHNARKAGSGMVNVVGDHATSHLKYDAPLASDLDGLARPYSHWLRRADGPHTIATDVARATTAARKGRIATLILPGDASWGEAGDPPDCPIETPVFHAPKPGRVDAVAKIFKNPEGPILVILGGRACQGEGLKLAGKLAAATGCRLATQFFTGRIARGAGRTPLERIPYFVAPALEFLKDFRHIVTVETGEPVAFFSYPDSPSLLKPESCDVHGLAEKDEDGAAGLDMLLDALGARTVAPKRQERIETPVPSGKLDPQTIALALAAALPENAIVVDESLTTGRNAAGFTLGAAPHDMLQNMGGSIGFSTPVATGAALACPDRRVISMTGDGSAMYTIQSLWTQARENLNVTTIIFANRAYQILKAEYANMGFPELGPRAAAMMEIDRPTLDFVALAKGMGVPGLKVASAEAFFRALQKSCAEPGPMLIEVCL
ncbi:acetolactate synthase-1/2/3 large subunit [Rhodoblastus acidophilus]|uniref:Acetolactate synthase-1/2/3 large subunit n=1 Tax=Rhodoblastus acidophilus TaxID=1074 RepID=A0A212QZC7_RHOAC|nr:acetolactate synthase large subunit [Rhodoblastus acidophilus]PPQ40538.1 acetolactate synthase large subunit [Rhodoblastus acidophilus]RAI18626.1 acetolactate synthase large subunit [Rhodoblastus acidophilus]SNB65091.1 acetolactate synthase-1/2/3 large subunit [Rhodoblastus acidophilus]